MKLGLPKSYDRVHWEFQCKVLKALGFNNKVVNLIRQLISTSNTSILLNGDLQTY